MSQASRPVEKADRPEARTSSKITRYGHYDKLQG